jgi:hypothetical protein
MKMKRILLVVIVGLAAFIGGICLLARTLGNEQPTLYRGRTPDYWAAQVTASDVTASNQANAVLNAEIIPRLTDVMLHDTHDSKLHTMLIGILNGLPGIQIDYSDAPDRRIGAAADLGNFGPAAGAASRRWCRRCKATMWRFTRRR